MFSFKLKRYPMRGFNVMKDWEPDTVEVILADQNQTVTSLLEVFKDFLQGCGYSIDGEIQVVKEEERVKDTNS